MTDRDRSQIYLEMSKEAIGEIMKSKLFCNRIPLPDDELLKEWNRRFAMTAQKKGVEVD